MKKKPIFPEWKKLKPKKKFQDIRNRCLTCDRVLRGKQTKFCSKACRDKHWNSRAIRRVHRTIQEKLCLQCDAPLTGRQSKYCSRACGIKYRKQQTALVRKKTQGKCIKCRKKLTGKQTKFCSPECNTKNFKKWQTQEKKALQECVYCGTLLEYGYQYRKFCDRECMISYFQKINNLEPIKPAIKDYQVSERILSDRRLAAMQNEVFRLTGFSLYDD